MKKMELVCVKQGTASTRRFSNGNTLPLTQLPFGMASFAPQTASNRGNWFYHPDDRCLEGIRLTHQPSPWIGDYGGLILMPQSGVPETEPARRWSGSRPEEQVLRPDYLRAGFLRSGAVFELTPVQRGAAFRVRFPEDGRRAYLSVLPVGGDFVCAWDPDRRVLRGSTSHCPPGRAEGFRMYFVLEVSGEVLPGESLSGTGGYHLALAGRELEGRLAISYISPEQAAENLRQELAGRSFDALREQAADRWEEVLSRVEVETGTQEELRTFYSCMYRLFLYPHKCYERTADGEALHFCPRDSSVRKGVRYTDNGFWDTFRTSFPLLTILAPKELPEILEGFLQDYRDGSPLPWWSSMGEAGCMPSSLIDAVIADAAVKGLLPRESLETAFQGMLYHANTAFPERRFGRNGVREYLQYGYVPCDKEPQSVNLTLDAAYGDFCIAQVAHVLGRPEEAEYRRRAGNYRLLFDPETGFMRARDTGGGFRPGFSPLRWGGEYTEGGAWQSSFFVPHDLEGLAALHGGREALLRKLRQMFDTPPVYEVGEYGTEIHEMTEMAAVDFGQCAISNQPSFHVPYLFAALGSQGETDFWVEKICRELFSSADDGFPGDEDNGSMAAWYLFSCLGLYPLCPGTPVYIKGKKLVRSARIHGVEWDPAGFDRWIPHDALPVRK